MSKPKEINKNEIDSTKLPNAKFDLPFILFLLGSIILVFFRYRLVDMPLERDEGEYAYMGNLILKGIAPYQDAFNMKLPGTNIMYALIMLIFGKSYSGIHLGLLLINIATVYLLYLSFNKLFKNGYLAAASAVLFGFMSLSMNYLGFAAHATHFVTFYVALSLFFYSNFQTNKSFVNAFLVGLFIGMAFLCKQQAVFFILGMGLIMLVNEFLTSERNILKGIINITLFSIGVFVPYLLIIIWVLAAGSFDKFWFWTYEYASKYAAGVSWDEGKQMLDMIFKPMWDEYKFIFVLSFLSVILVWFSKFDLKSKIIFFVLFIVSFLTVCPGFYFRQHYFIPWLPFVALGAGISLDFVLSYIKNEKLKIAIPLIFLIVIFVAISKNKIYYTKTKPEKLSKMIYGTNPFIESVEIANYIKNNSAENDEIGILGSEPQILVYADRKSSTGHIYTYGMMEIHDYNIKMQSEMINDLEMKKPKFLVYCNVRTSWLPRPGSPMGIFEWYGNFVKQNYDLVGIADMANPSQTQFWWDGDVQTHQPQGQEYVLIFKRKV